MAETNIGKITQIIGAVLDIKFTEGKLPRIRTLLSLPNTGGMVWNCFFDSLIKKL